MADITFVAPENLSEISQLTGTSVVLVDASGNALAKMPTETFKEIVKLGQIDSVPTEGSTNAVSSGGVKAALDDVETALASAEERLTVLEVQHISKSVPASTVGNDDDFAMVVNTTADNRLYRKAGGAWKELSAYDWRRFIYRGVTFVKADAERTSPFRVEGQTVNAKHYIYSASNVVYPNGREQEGDIGVVYDISCYGDYLCFFYGDKWVLLNSPLYYDGEVLAWYGDEVHVVDDGLVGPIPNASQKGRLKKDVIDCRFMATSFANLGGDDGDYALILAASNNHRLARNFNGTWAYLWNYADGQRFTFGGRTYTKATNANTDLFTETSGGLRPLYEAAGAVYNATTGYYELNGLTDISEEQMAEIYAIGIGWHPGMDSYGRFAYQRIRTNILPTSEKNASGTGCGVLGNNNYIAVAALGMFDSCIQMEVACVGVSRNAYFGIFPKSALNMFNNCRVLRKIIGYIVMIKTDANQTTNMFKGCAELREVSIRRLTQNLSFADSPLLYYSSLKYLVDNASNTAAITVTVHKTVYECLTGLHTSESDAKIEQEAEEVGSTASQLWSDYQTLRNDAAQLHNISFAEP